jgi:hypothetical protein
MEVRDKLTAGFASTCRQVKWKLMFDLASYD